jgi:DNA-binding response OmpR family regulator
VFRRTGASAREAVADTSASIATDETSREPAGPRRLLLVEDDELMRRFAAEVLHCAGFEVDTAAHGGEALSRLHESTSLYHLVVLDLVLPWVNGLQVLAAMRNNERTRDIPVVIITGTVMTKHDFAGERQLTVLRKPFEPERLVSSVNLMLHGGDAA